MAQTDWLVPVSWIAANLGERVKLVDARWYLTKHNRDADAEYRSGHLPSAIPLDLSTDLADLDSPLRNTLAPPNKVERVLGERGLVASDTVVVYDDKGFSACRVATLLYHYGQERVMVLDGGYSAWVAAGHPIESGPFKPKKKSTYQTRIRRQSKLVDKNSVMSALDEAQTFIVDARSRLRFDGLDGERTTGHMAGAIHLHYGEFFRAGTAFFKSKEELSAIFESKGLHETASIISSCGSGVTACIPLWARKILGWSDAALYDGSWDEWSRDERAPIERGYG
jgi:thiosulfate/3-mercaptopyruvate sulfurtransferase